MNEIDDALGVERLPAMSHLEELACNVARARKREQALRDNYARLKRAFDDETAPLKQCLDDAVIITQEEEDALRSAMVWQYLEDGKKKQTGGTIRVVRKLFYDAKAAWNYALEHKMFLKVDTAGFEKYAKETPLDFVTMHDAPTAAIDSDLSAFLKDGMTADSQTNGIP